MIQNNIDFGPLRRGQITSWDIWVHASVAAGGGLLAANNLSDVASPVAAKDNISTKGTDIASAATTNIAGATGDFVDVTGTVTITALGTAAAGVERTVRFTGALTLTHNAASLILPTGANIATAAGDSALFRSLGSGNWLCVAYQRTSGQALVAGSGGLIRPIPFFFTTTPTASEVLAIYAAVEAFTLSANLAGAQVKKIGAGANPAATFALDVQQNGTSIGTISIATSGVVTLTTAGGTSKAVASGDVLHFIGPATADSTIANWAINLKGTL